MVSILSQRGGSLKCTSRPALLGGEMTMQSIRQLEKALNASTRRVDELCTENEKLRGLVWDMWLDLDVPQLDSEEYRRRMRELGWKWPDECG